MHQNASKTLLYWYTKLYIHSPTVTKETVTSNFYLLTRQNMASRLNLDEVVSRPFDDDFGLSEDESSEEEGMKTEVASMLLLGRVLLTQKN